MYIVCIKSDGIGKKSLGYVCCPFFPVLLLVTDVW